MDRFTEYYRRRKIFRSVALLCIAATVLSLFIESRAMSLALPFISVIVISSVYSYLSNSRCGICGEKLLNLWGQSFGMAIFLPPKNCDNCARND